MSYADISTCVTVAHTNFHSKPDFIALPLYACPDSNDVRLAHYYHRLLNYNTRKLRYAESGVKANPPTLVPVYY